MLIIVAPKIHLHFVTDRSFVHDGSGDTVEIQAPLGIPWTLMMIHLLSTLESLHKSLRQFDW
jgi:hypothetical protein